MFQIIEGNPCLSCGACCAFFRVSFYWGEADDTPEGTVPLAMVEDIAPFRRAMVGTNQPSPRCVALEGEVGGCVRCTIYEQRSSTCRNFTASWEDGKANPDCDRARMQWGLPPLLPPVTPEPPRPSEDEHPPSSPLQPFRRIA